MDWLFLAGGAFLCASPTLLVLDLWAEPARMALALVPWGYLLFGLVMVLVLAILPGLRLDVGLSAPRWLTIAIILTACGFTARTLAFFVTASDTTGMSTGSYWQYGIFLPFVLVMAVLFVLTRLFLDRPFHAARGLK